MMESKQMPSQYETCGQNITHQKFPWKISDLM